MTRNERIRKSIFWIGILLIGLGLINALVSSLVVPDTTEKSPGHNEVIKEIEQIDEELKTITPDTVSNLDDALRVLRD